MPGAEHCRDEDGGDPGERLEPFEIRRQVLVRIVEDASLELLDLLVEQAGALQVLGGGAQDVGPGQEGCELLLGDPGDALTRVVELAAEVGDGRS